MKSFLLTTFAFFCCSGPVALGFAPITIGLPVSSLEQNTVSSSSLPRLYKTSISNSRDQAEQYLTDSFPKFTWLLQQNSAALERMRGSKTGFAVFAPSDASIDSTLSADQIQLLEAASNDPGMQQIVSRMAAYHMVSVPTTSEIMATYNVVSTRVGELPVEVANDGSLYVNGVGVIQSYQFEDKMVQNYADSQGNILGSEAVEGGKTCIVHEVEGLVCPNELWEALYAQYETSGASNVY